QAPLLHLRIFAGPRGLPSANHIRRPSNSVKGYGSDTTFDAFENFDPALQSQRERLERLDIMFRCVSLRELHPDQPARTLASGLANRHSLLPLSAYWTDSSSGSRSTRQRLLFSAPRRLPLSAPHRLPLGKASGDTSGNLERNPNGLLFTPLGISPRRKKKACREAKE
ncbi:MAG: hypothetical protein SGPRY_004681, partial [Prymnesium sp.]